MVAASTLDRQAFLERAERIRLVLTDVDGTLTDGTVYVSKEGEAMKRFSLRDGMGVERLPDAGIDTGLVTREVSPPVAQRAQKLDIRHVFCGVRDKAAYVPEILARAGTLAQEVASIGDDVNDLGILQAIGEVGLTGAPADAVPIVRRAVHHIAAARGGGQKAFREFVQWILSSRDTGTEP